MQLLQGKSCSQFETNTRSHCLPIHNHTHMHCGNQKADEVWRLHLRVICILLLTFKRWLIANVCNQNTHEEAITNQSCMFVYHLILHFLRLCSSYNLATNISPNWLLNVRIAIKVATRMHHTSPSIAPNTYWCMEVGGGTCSIAKSISIATSEKYNYSPPSIIANCASSAMQTHSHNNKDMIFVASLCPFGLSEFQVFSCSGIMSRAFRDDTSIEPNHSIKVSRKAVRCTPSSITVYYYYDAKLNLDDHCQRGPSWRCYFGEIPITKI